MTHRTTTTWHLSLLSLLVAAQLGCDKRNEVDASTTTVNGKCTGAFQHCSNGPADRCETNTELDVANCGACGHACSAVHGKPTCAAALCSIACDEGFADCNGDVADGCEVDLGTSVDNCSACGAACAGSAPVCDAGVCRTACPDGPADVATDPKNCGACGNVCSSVHGTAGCSNGACVLVCDEGYGDCDGDVDDGCETSVASSVAHCGACGNACNASHGTPSCSLGACGIVCDAGYADCAGANDGCETPLSTLANCAACGDTCQVAHGKASCDVGVCSVASCDGGYHPCAGGCAADADPKACGAQCEVCAVPTNAVGECKAGACGWKCAVGFADCDGLADNGCEVATTGDKHNCGACGVDCLQGSCSNSKCEAAVLATGLVQASDLAAEGGEACWREDSAVRCMVAAGGAPQIIDAAAKPQLWAGSRIYLSSSNYYWVGDGLFRMPRGGGAAEKIVALVKNSMEDETFQSVVGVDDDVLASSLYNYHYDGAYSHATRVRHVSKAGVATKLADMNYNGGDSSPWQLAVRGSQLAYWARNNWPGVYVVDWTSQAPKSALIDTAPSVPSSLQLGLDDTYLYKPDENKRRLQRIHLVGLQATDVTANCDWGQFVVWPDNVACTSYDTLRWVRGASDTVLYKGGGQIVALAMDASALYWLENDPQTGLFRLVQLAKPAP
jgi:hypothetical protein